MKTKFKLIYLTLFCLEIFIPEISFAVNSSVGIVDKAKLLIDAPYKWEQPPNKEWIYGGTFDLSSWTKQNGLDCSGLVSYAGELRRHYGVSELLSFVNRSSWNILKPGDLILTPGHIRIFEGRYTDESNIQRLITIEASPSKEKVIRKGPGPDDYIGYKDPNIYPSGGLIDENAFPATFKTDDTAPTLEISGVKDGAEYSSAVTVTMKKLDNIESKPYGYGEYNGKKFLSKEFTKEGTYSVSFHAEDWVKLSKDNTITFTIGDSAPPSQPSPPGGDQPDDNNSVSSSDYPTPWLYDQSSKIGVLVGGWGKGLNNILGKFQVATTIVDEDLLLSDTSGKALAGVEVLCIGSGGLVTIASSPAARRKLETFVSQGGRLVVLTVQNGSEWQALPGGEVAGYGWAKTKAA